MTNRSKHNLRVLAHHDFSLQFFLSGNVCENEDHLPLHSKVVCLDSHVIVDAIEALVHLVIQTFHFLRCDAVFIIFVVFFAR